MKIAVLIARILLGVIFLFFGLDHILNFWKMGLPPGDPGAYATILFTHGVFSFVGVLQAMAGLLLLVGRYVPLALTVLAPIIVNILVFGLMIAHGGFIPDLVTLVLEVFLIVAYRRNFIPLLEASPEPTKP